MKFCLSLKIIKETEQKTRIFKKQQTLHRQTAEIKQLKQFATLKCNYSSSQMVELHPLFRLPQDHSTLRPKQLFPSLVRAIGNFSEKNAKLTLNPFILLSIVRNEEVTE